MIYLKGFAMFSNFSRAVAALLLEAALSASAQGQTFPNKPIRLLVGFPPGGTTDIVSRIVGERMGAQMGQVVIIENKPGATGVIALDVLIKSPSDGYTISFIASPTLISALVNTKDINAERDFSPIGLIYRQGFFISLNPSVPEFKGVNTLGDLIAVVKAHPGKINYATIGVGSTGHLTGELMASRAGLQWTHIPYKGASLLLQEVLSGQAPLVDIGGVVEDARDSQGKIINLAVSSTKRHPLAPNVPTLAESGFPGVDASSWGGLVAPAGVPKAVIGRLVAEYKTAYDNPTVNEKLVRWIPEYMGPAELNDLMKQTIQTWGKVIKDVGMKP